MNIVHDKEIPQDVLFTEGDIINIGNSYYMLAGKLQHEGGEVYSSKKVKTALNLGMATTTCIEHPTLKAVVTELTENYTKPYIHIKANDVILDLNGGKK